MKYHIAVLSALLLLAGACGSGGESGAADEPDSGEPTSADEGANSEDSSAADPGDQAEGSGQARPQTLGEQTTGVVEGASATVINLLGPDGGVPLSDGDFADPFVLDSGLIPYGFTTNSTTAKCRFRDRGCGARSSWVTPSPRSDPGLRRGWSGRRE